MLDRFHLDYNSCYSFSEHCVLHRTIFFTHHVMTSARRFMVMVFKYGKGGVFARLTFGVIVWHFGRDSLLHLQNIVRTCFGPKILSTRAFFFSFCYFTKVGQIIHSTKSACFPCFFHFTLLFAFLCICYGYLGKGGCCSPGDLAACVWLVARPLNNVVGCQIITYNP